jgi:hypothetical protein
MPAFLARRYAVATDVERRDDQPYAFTWRGRRYVVRAVLDHWWETTAWWQAQGQAQGQAQAGAAPAGSVTDDERERWRVEAVGSRGGPIVVELCFAWVTGRWTVDTVMD